jgi:hypothetical protein
MPEMVAEPHSLADQRRKRVVKIRNVPIRDFLKMRKMKLILAVKPYTLITYARLSELYEKAVSLEKKQINGSFVECGVCNGGSAGILSWVARHNRNRRIWLFDSWEGMPEPTASDISSFGALGKKGIALGSEIRTRELLFGKLALRTDNIRLVKGWFNDTIIPQKEAISDIALLHLDCDWYESVKYCLNELYDRVVQGGYVFIDDYGDWKGCKMAVDEFIRERGLSVELIKIDYTGVFLQKK